MTEAAANIEVVNIDVARKNTSEGIEPKTAQPEQLKLDNLVPQTSSFDQVSAREFL